MARSLPAPLLLAPLLLALPLLATTPAHARIVSLEILDQRPFASGVDTGPAGPYLLVTARAHGELDPTDPANAPIALLDKAPRNARGLFEYDTDVTILRPQDLTRGSGVMLYDVLNRGNKFAPSWLDDAREPPGGMLNDMKSRADMGNGFTFRRGYTMVWSGWQPEAPTTNTGMTIRVPIAKDNGLPIARTIRVEIQSGTRSPDGVRLLPLPYPTADMQQAQLFTRARESDPRQPVPRHDWSWVDHTTIQLLPFGTTPTPRHITDFVYEARDPTVDGIGFAAVRDVVSYLRTPLATHHTIGFGVSLSGRFLRHFLDLGMNKDEAGARVFDGMLPHIAGAGKVFANEPFAMPGRTATQHEDRFYPEVWQPVSYVQNHAAGHLLRDPATDPRIIETNTSTEYWQKGASLVHTDAAGHDAPLPPGVRMLLIAGTQHGGHFGSTNSPGFCANPRNPNSAGPALRAAIVDLEDWIVRGTTPPDSLVPRQFDQTAIPAAAIHMPNVPGTIWAPRDNPIGQPVDWTNPPPAPVHPMPTFVAAVDADGNEIAGLRLPNLAVPLGTYTGVSVYKDLTSELCDRDGIYIPFARTKADREKSGDPRPSLEERYASREDYIAKLTAAADQLVTARRLLKEDRDRYIETAKSAPGW